MRVPNPTLRADGMPSTLMCVEATEHRHHAAVYPDVAEFVETVMRRLGVGNSQQLADRLGEPKKWRHYAKLINGDHQPKFPIVMNMLRAAGMLADAQDQDQELAVAVARYKRLADEYEVELGRIRQARSLHGCS